jgi:leucyl-tRNA synthetase
MFMGPLEHMKPWQTHGIEGVKRFLERAWNVCTGTLGDAEAYDDATRRLVHKTVKKVTEDIEAMRFNTAISAMMILVKHLTGLAVVPRDAARTMALLVGPFAPHVGEEIWSRLHGDRPEAPPVRSVAHEPWPEFDPALVEEHVVEIGVQVNGKFRGTITIAVDADEGVAREAALKEDRVRAHLEGKPIKKFIYVKGKIVSFIVGA